MFLARREFGKIVRIYPVSTLDQPTIWPFEPRNPETRRYTQAALNAGTGPGQAATGRSRAEALKNLGLAEFMQPGVDAPMVLE